MDKKKIPVFILAGGLGTRISEESHLKPKPMIEIGDIPILVHVMRWYYSFGFNDFVILAGYRAWEIKQYFLNYEFRQNDLLIDHRKACSNPPVALRRGKTSKKSPSGTYWHEQEKWRVRVIDTGLDCMTGGRVARAFDLVAATDNFENFALTYGDGLCDVNLDQELHFHLKHDRTGTILGTPPLARFGELDVQKDNRVASFLEKPQSRQGLINGGFFFFKRGFRQYLSDESSCILERKPLASLAEDGELSVWKHLGFWQPMDTLRDKTLLQQLWESGKAPWLVSNRPGQ